jgi:AcrR family transcriptional regulator
MAPRTNLQNLELREATRKRIMETAMELFATEGFHTTSVSTIATKAGIAKGLMYNYFESKEELLHHIIFNNFDYIMESFDMNRDGVLTQQELIHFINTAFTLFKKNYNFWKLYYTILTQPAVMNIVMKDFHARYQSFYQILTDYFRANNYQDPETEMRLLVSLLDGVAMNYLMEKDAYPIDRVKEKIIKMYEELKQ